LFLRKGIAWRAVSMTTRKALKPKGNKWVYTERELGGHSGLRVPYL
jgi:hypothetical protein